MQGCVRQRLWRSNDEHGEGGHQGFPQKNSFPSKKFKVRLSDFLRVRSFDVSNWAQPTMHVVMIGFAMLGFFAIISSVIKCIGMKNDYQQILEEEL